MAVSALMCMALAIYMEARGEPIESKIAVAAVTLNRTKDKDYPSTICGVVNQSGQYTWNKKVKIREPKAYKESKRIAYLYLNNKLYNPIGHRIYFNHRSLGKKYRTPYRAMRPNRKSKLIFY